ncbi:hypothetical protein KKF91_06110 [Myxococcota bacterium]|nr:hypothetical protein [Myxococcota bacterium]MBU1430126.1 hypothetical protein [Myxococcota bacterium]MBU1896469.1 hypothetical protein [Myxococcota bacterium]
MSEPKPQTTKRKRPYQKPGFESTHAFERRALSCPGALNLCTYNPALGCFCTNKS